MPAVYGIDLIAKRDRKIKMDRSIVKGWNVHYQTLEEVEAEARAKKQKQEEEAQKNAERLSEEADEQSNKRQQTEEEEKRRKEAYNPKTGAYSGHYGKQPVEDEGQKHQIDAILNEKPEPFEYAMSSLQAQNQDGQ